MRLLACCLQPLSLHGRSAVVNSLTRDPFILAYGSTSRMLHSVNSLRPRVQQSMQSRKRSDMSTTPKEPIEYYVRSHPSRSFHVILSFWGCGLTAACSRYCTALEGNKAKKPSCNNASDANSATCAGDRPRLLRTRLDTPTPSESSL